MSVASPMTSGGQPAKVSGPTLGVALAPLAIAWSIAIARFPLNDNSFFTHLATGRLILDRGSVPTSDPYSFTAPDVSWTVQSWLASIGYAGAERLGGDAGLRLLVVVGMVVAALLVLALSAEATSLVARILIVGSVLVVATDLWTVRPYMVGFIGLCLVWLALDGRLAPWSLVPLLWVWGNSHGSFVLAGVLVVTVLIGRRLDGEDVGRQTRVLATVVIGTLGSIVGPLMFRGLLFPLRTFTRSSDLQRIVEWRAPDFTETYDRIFLVIVAATIVGLVRRPAWRRVLPAVVFIVMALVARRNIVMALPILVPVLSASFGDVGSLRSDDRRTIARAVAGVSTVTMVLAAVALFGSPLVRLDGYPTRAISLLDDGDPSVRVATQDFTGNLLEVLDGPSGSVFIDDRVDMYPSELVADYQVLLDGRPGWETVLADHEVTAVVWASEKPLAQLLMASPAWRSVFVDEAWIVACRRGSCSVAGTG